MKKNLFENIAGLFNGNNNEKIANINSADTDINDDIFNDGSFIEDVLNSKESVKLGIMAQLCKTNYN